jgi:SAM-dependent methyltransferase
MKMGEFSNYFNQQMENLMQYAGNDVDMNSYSRYYKKSRTRYRDFLSLAYPFLLEGNKSVLDIGGYEMGALCRPLAASVQCVSLSVPNEELKAHFDINVDVVDIMGPTFSLERKGYDLIFFCEVLEHLPPPTDLIMKRLRGLLNPGGRLVLSVPNLAFWQKRLKFFFFGRSPLKLGDQRDSFGVYYHIRTYTYDECMTLLNRYGFKVLKRRSGNYQRYWHYPFYWLEWIFTGFAHKLIFLAAPKEIP